MYKQIKVEGTTYYIQDKSDLIALTKELLDKGYTIEQIARIYGVTTRTVIKYLSEC